VTVWFGAELPIFSVDDVEINWTSFVRIKYSWYGVFYWIGYRHWWIIRTVSFLLVLKMMRQFVLN